VLASNMRMQRAGWINWFSGCVGSASLNSIVMRYRDGINPIRVIASVSVAAVFMLSACDIALGQTFAPASLVRLHGIEDFRCPISPQRPVLICQVIIADDGRAQNDASTHCFGSIPHDLDRARDLRSEMLRSKFEPAKVDGKAVEVYASFRVSFSGEGDTCDITVFPNLGEQQNEFGSEYFAPQEIRTDGGWSSRVPRAQRSGWRIRRWSGTAFAMSVAVDALGNASDGRVEDNNFAREEAVESAVRALEKSRFVPLIVNGHARAGRYFEFLYVQPFDTRPGRFTRPKLR